MSRRWPRRRFRVAATHPAGGVEQRRRRDWQKDLCTAVAETAGRESSIIGTVIATAREFVCNDTGRHRRRSDELIALLAATGMHSVVVMPLLIDGTTIAVLVLAARDSDVVGEEELTMLRDVAGNLSFGLQYLQRDITRAFSLAFRSADRPGKAPPVLRARAAPAREARRHARPACGGRVRHRAARASSTSPSAAAPATCCCSMWQSASSRPATASQVAHFGGGTFAMVRHAWANCRGHMREFGRLNADTAFWRTLPDRRPCHSDHGPHGYCALARRCRRRPCPWCRTPKPRCSYARAIGERHLRYSAAARSSIVGQLALEHRLRFALERGEFELHYQPKINVASRRIQGAEALLRWRSSEDGLVSPAVFLPSLEASGLIVQVGEWVVQQAARDCQRWMKAGLPPVRIAVNIAAGAAAAAGFRGQLPRRDHPLVNAGLGAGHRDHRRRAAREFRRMKWTSCAACANRACASRSTTSARAIRH